MSCLLHGTPVEGAARLAVPFNRARQRRLHALPGCSLSAYPTFAPIIRHPAKKDTCCARVQYPRPEFVGADLSKMSLRDALAPTSFDPAHRALFIAEGLTYYLPPQAMRWVGRVRGPAPGACGLSGVPLCVALAAIHQQFPAHACGVAL